MNKYDIKCDVVKQLISLIDYTDKQKCEDKKRFLVYHIMELATKLFSDHNILNMIEPFVVERLQQVILLKLNENSWHLLKYKEYYRIISGNMKFNKPIHESGKNMYGKLRPRL